jgi:hypothetical protein
MNMQSENDRDCSDAERIVTRVLISAALHTSVIAATLVWVVAPLLRANAAIAESPQSSSPFAHAMASAVSGFVLLLGLAPKFVSRHVALPAARFC